MRNLVSIHPKQVIRHVGEPNYLSHFGLLRSPRNPSHIPIALKMGAVWACDNDVFSEYNPNRIRRFLEVYAEYAPTCQFFNVPDVLRDAQATLDRFGEWVDSVKAFGWKVAFTLQNGMERFDVPWSHIDALWLGATDEWRYDRQREYVLTTLYEARKRGKWTHVGRVSTVRKIRYWQASGVVRSFDSTGYTINPSRSLQHMVHHQGFRQLFLWETV